MLNRERGRPAHLRRHRTDRCPQASRRPCRAGGPPALPVTRPYQAGGPPALPVTRPYQAGGRAARAPNDVALPSGRSRYSVEPRATDRRAPNCGTMPDWRAARAPRMVRYTSRTMPAMIGLARRRASAWDAGARWARPMSTMTGLARTRGLARAAMRHAWWTGTPHPHDERAHTACPVLSTSTRLTRLAQREGEPVQGSVGGDNAAHVTAPRDAWSQRQRLVGPAGDAVEQRHDAVEAAPRAPIGDADGEIDRADGAGRGGSRGTVSGLCARHAAFPWP